MNMLIILHEDTVYKYMHTHICAHTLITLAHMYAPFFFLHTYITVTD